MTRRKRSTSRPLDDRVTSRELNLPHRSTIARGTEITVYGIGRCRFVQYVRKTDGAEWVDVMTSAGRSRTVRPDRIVTVHRTRRIGGADT